MNQLSNIDIVEFSIHMTTFGLMVDFAKKNGIKSFGYGDVPGGGHSTLGSHTVVNLRSVYGEKAIDYTDEYIFYKIDT